MMPPGGFRRTDWSLIHPSAWKENSPKFVCRILHNPDPTGTKMPDNPAPAPYADPHMLWSRIKMHLFG
jgi:hypothetical protein